MSNPAVDLQIMVLNRAQPKCAERLREWLGEAGERQFLAASATTAALPYILIATIDTRAAPKYLHAVELYPDITRLIERLISLLRHMRTTRPLALDIAYAVEPREREHINSAIDEHLSAMLLHAKVAGHA
jgi:hypothetical protein